MKKKGSGILLHISSLPSPFCVGDLGDEAYKFVDFLADCGQKYWQILPLNPTSAINGNSPYSSASAFACNYIFISPRKLIEKGLLEKEDIKNEEVVSIDKVNYEKAYELKNRICDLAFSRFVKGKEFFLYNEFCRKNKYWLDDYASFIVFKENFGYRVWSDWPQEIRDREKKALTKLKVKLKEKIEREKFLQYLCFTQWHELKMYANKKGVKIIGDIPIYVTYDSVDAWTNPDIFKLNRDKKLDFVAGVPPDYFSKTGQLWGNPVYDWDALKKNKYKWWIKRVEHNLKLFDLARIDHFRGFVDFWEVPSGEETAVNGKWQKAPALDFFNVLLKRFPGLPIIAEDLGIITEEVKDVMKFFKFPGMKILIFAFGEDLIKHPFLPHNYTENCVVYTGTHDNNTIKGWFEFEARIEDKNRLVEYIGHKVLIDKIHWEFIELAMKSIAKVVIFPLQDVLGLGGESRMNIPGVAGGNWQWRLNFEQITSQTVKRLAQLTKSNSR
ncbi:MAG: 4-alpha-glucanotransferase [Candidatus Omnitrophica bacterium]|nr:4-alpha-glucanotransferase [Candidatus Omnitrophota bacterium]